MGTNLMLPRLSRRAFLGMAATSAGALGAAGLGFGAPAAVLGARPTSTSRNPLYIPPVVGPSNLSLAAKSATVDLGGGHNSTAWVYNGLLPGPTIVATKGDNVSVVLHNELSQPTITHWHGMLVTHENDGHPMMAVDPGGAYSYAFPVVNRAALNWYHPHPHMLTGEQVAMGLAGGFIIRDATETALGLPAGGREVPLVLRDTTLDKTGNLSYRPRTGGFEGVTPLVNGTLNPGLGVDSALYRFRVLGGSNARIFRLALSNGDPFTLIGNDGGLLASAVQIGQIDLAPGERLDLLIDFRGKPVGTKVMLRDLRAGWDLLEFTVQRTVADSTPVPTALSTITPLTNPLRTRDFSFDGMSKINGLEYDMNRISFDVPFGQTELWRFRTNGNAPHPVHIHGASFQVVSRSGGRNQLYPWEAGWKDTVLLEDQEQVEVLVRFDAYQGIYLMHCHKLEHEDMGMMLNFRVV